MVCTCAPGMAGPAAQEQGPAALEIRMSAALVVVPLALPVQRHLRLHARCDTRVDSRLLLPTPDMKKADGVSGRGVLVLVCRAIVAGASALQPPQPPPAACGGDVGVGVAGVPALPHRRPASGAQRRLTQGTATPTWIPDHGAFRCHYPLQRGVCRPVFRSPSAPPLVGGGADGAHGGAVGGGALADAPEAQWTSSLMGSPPEGHPKGACLFLIRPFTCMLRAVRPRARSDHCHWAALVTQTHRSRQRSELRPCCKVAAWVI